MAFGRIGRSCIPRTAVMFCGILLAGCAGPVAGTGQPSAASQAAAINSASRELAVQAERGNRYELAAQHYRNLLQDQSDDPLVVLGLARNLRYAGNPQIAVKVLQDFLPSFENSAELRLELAKAFLAADDTKAAQPLLNKLLGERPKDWRVHSASAILFDRQGDMTAALTAHRRAYDLAPREPQAINNLALAIAIAGDLTKAIALLDPLVQGGNAPLNATQNLSIFYALNGDLDIAQTLARRSLPPDLAAEQVLSLQALAAKGPAGLPSIPR